MFTLTSLRAHRVYNTGGMHPPILGGSFIKILCNPYPSCPALFLQDSENVWSPIVYIDCHIAELIPLMSQTFRKQASPGELPWAPSRLVSRLEGTMAGKISQIRCLSLESPKSSKIYPECCPETTSSKISNLFESSRNLVKSNQEAGIYPWRRPGQKS